MRVACAILIAIGLPTAAATIEGKVVSIADGDTITILDGANVHHRVSIHGIDAPEKEQAFGQRGGPRPRSACHGLPSGRMRRQTATNVTVLTARSAKCGSGLQVVPIAG